MATGNTTTMSSAADLNSLAIGQYLQGNYEPALKLMVQALSLLRWQMDHPAEEENHGDKQQVRYYTCQAVDLVPLSEESMRQNGCLFPFYNRPFALVPTMNPVHEESSAGRKCSEQEDSDGKDHLTVQFMAVMYNAALLHHTIALHHHCPINRRAKHLQQALKMYELTFQVQEEQEEISSEQFHLLLAVCNNAAFLHSYNRDIVAVNECLHLLKELYEDFDEHESTLFLSEEEYLFFFTTSMLFPEGQNQLTLAPAA